MSLGAVNGAQTKGPIFVPRQVNKKQTLFVLIPRVILLLSAKAPFCNNWQVFKFFNKFSRE